MILVDDLVDRGPHSADQHEAHRREDADRGRPPPIGAAEERGPSPSPRSPRRRRTPPFPPSASSPRRDSHPDKGERKKDDLGSAARIGHGQLITGRSSICNAIRIARRYTCREAAGEYHVSIEY